VRAKPATARSSSGETARPRARPSRGSHPWPNRRSRPSVVTSSPAIPSACASTHQRPGRLDRLLAWWLRFGQREQIR
jgi:hypothetical protein